MLLAIDAGNSNTVLGLYGEDAKLLAHWRITTPEARTVDELGVLLRSLFDLHDLRMSEVTGIAISSVVPPLDPILRHMCETYFRLRPLFVEPGVRTGLPVLTDNPAEAGADRICNCIAAFEKTKAPTIVVDMGTATTFDVVSGRGEFLGGAIAPGLGISADALFLRAARLPRIEVKKPAKIIGTGTVDNIQIGLYYGYIGLVDGILERMMPELVTAEFPHPRTIATGGLARLIASGSKYLEDVDEMLTLTGLRMVYERNLARQEKQKRRGF